MNLDLKMQRVKIINNGRTYNSWKDCLEHFEKKLKKKLKWKEKYNPKDGEIGILLDSDMVYNSAYRQEIKMHAIEMSKSGRVIFMDCGGKEGGFKFIKGSFKEEAKAIRKHLKK